MLWLNLFLISLVFSPAELSASNLSIPTDFPSAKVLPKGVRNLRYKGMAFGAREKFNNSGEVVPLGDAMNKSITFNDSIDGKTTASDKGKLAGFVNGQTDANGNQKYSTSDSIGNATGDVRVNAVVHAPIFGYGVSERLTLALVVPFVDIEMDVDSAYQKNNNAEVFASDLCHTHGLCHKEQEAERDLADPVSKAASDDGYGSVTGESKTELGDIQLVSKLQLLKQESYLLAFQTGLTLPTGKPKDVNKLVSIPTGDGQLDVGFDVIQEIRLSRDFTFAQSIGYIFQLEDTVAERIPDKSDSKMSPDVDYAVNRDLGDHFKTQVAGLYEFSSGWTLGVGASFQIKQEDKFEGDEFAAERYEWLSVDTQQRFLAGQMGIEYSTVPLFRQKKFPVPFKARFHVAQAFQGKNVTRDPLAAVDLEMFF